MPRRRAVKNETTSRPDPTLPEGDEGKDMDIEKKREKVQALIRDFKTEVDSRVRSLRASINEMLNQVDLAYTMEMMNIPQKIRQMPLKEYLMTGGTFENAEVGKVLDDKLASILDEDSIMPGGGVPLESISETNAMDNKTRRVGRSKKVTGVVEGPAQTTRRGRALKTPAASKFNLSAATPLITPKFDPRLYQTPAVPMRVPKPGEVIVSMEGSPLMNPQAETQNPGAVVIPLKNSKVVVLDNKADLGQIDISQVDQKFLEMCSGIHMMQARLKSVKSFSSSSK